MQRADVILIGSGQGAVPLAAELAQEGRHVVLFERASWGGSCPNFACTPTKTLLASAHAAGNARHAQELGVYLEAQVDFSAVMERIENMVHSSEQRNRKYLEEAGVKLIHGEASFVDCRTVTDGKITIEAPIVVIDAGSSSRIPNIPGLKGTPYMTYVTFWDIRELPQRLLILGAGHTGMEIGQAMARLGSQVHTIEIRDRPLPDEELDVSRVLAQALWKDGVQFHASARISQVEYSDGWFTLTFEDGKTVQGEALLVAVGRKPNTEALHLEASGIASDEQGYIQVDSHLRTTCEGVYAIGDITGQPAFVNLAWEDYRRLKAILNGQDRYRGDRVLVYGFSTDPQVGRAGLTWEQAQEQGLKARVVTLNLHEVPRAREEGRTLGFYRVVINEETGQILGATLVSPSASELVHIFSTHMEAGSTWHTLDKSLYIHPTYAEGLLTLVQMLELGTGVPTPAYAPE